MDEDDCDLNGNCENTEGSFECSCNVGYSGDGVNCTSKQSVKYNDEGLYLKMNFLL